MFALLFCKGQSRLPVVSVETVPGVWAKFWRRWHRLSPASDAGRQRCALSATLGRASTARPSAS